MRPLGFSRGPALRQVQRQTQTLAMTPQLRQAIQLLQLSNLELHTWLEDALEANPLLARDDASETGAGENGGDREEKPRAETTDPAPLDFGAEPGYEAAAKKMTYAVDEDTVFRELPADKLFLTKTSIFITYPRINPLRVQATASATASAKDLGRPALVSTSTCASAGTSMTRRVLPSFWPSRSAMSRAIGLSWSRCVSGMRTLVYVEIPPAPRLRLGAQRQLAGQETVRL